VRLSLMACARSRSLARHVQALANSSNRWASGGAELLAAFWQRWAYSLACFGDVDISQKRTSRGPSSLRRSPVNPPDKQKPGGDEGF
jgi:hypothetical protein